MKVSKTVIALAILALVLLAGCSALDDGDRGETTVSDELQQIMDTAAPGEEIPIIIDLTAGTDLAPFKARAAGSGRSAAIKSLQQERAAAQASILERLTSEGAREITPLWIVNAIALKATPELIATLSGLEGIAAIKLDATLAAPPVTPATGGQPRWNLDAIHAPQLWAQGWTGQGVVVATLDTGVDLHHPDLEARWRGGVNSWYDPNGEHASPHDASGHGTQVMGLIVGGDAGGVPIGAAPGAQWIAAKIFNDAGVSTLSRIHLAYQWLLDPDGDPGTDDAPDVVNSSWGLIDHVGQCVPEFETDVAALAAAGIAVVGSAGNAGPGPSTDVSPANYPESISVGAFDAALTIASSSSRGPSSCNGSIFPRIAAPGISVRSADLTAGGAIPLSYAVVSGTSYASAHAAGALALLMSAVPGHLPAELESAIETTARDLGAVGPDNAFGFGILDITAAHHLLAGIGPCTDADLDGSYLEAGCGAASDCDDTNAAAFPGALEVKHDGVDQDCNGYDLTIEITRASYAVRRDALAVEATSALGAAAQLELQGVGHMEWNQVTGRWEIFVDPAAGDPSMIAVLGIEGEEQGSVVRTRNAIPVPIAPAGITVAAAGSAALRIGWNDLANNETGFLLERSESATGPFVIIAVVARNAVHALDSGLVSGRTYYYSLRAINPGGRSGPSPVAGGIAP